MHVISELIIRVKVTDDRWQNLSDDDLEAMCDECSEQLDKIADVAIDTFSGLSTQYQLEIKR